MTVATPDTALAQAGKYLTFMLDAKEFGVEILKVQEITGLTGDIVVKLDDGNDTFYAFGVNAPGNFDVFAGSGNDVAEDPSQADRHAAEAALHSNEFRHQPRSGIACHAECRRLNHRRLSASRLTAIVRRIFSSSALT